MYKLVLFDLDGTLVDTDLLVVEGFLHFFRKYKKEKVSLDVLVSFSGPSLKDSMKKYFPTYNTDEMVQEYKRVTWPLYETFIELYDGIEIVLSSLKNKGIKIGIVTSKARDATTKTLSQLHIEQYFDYIVCVDEVRKPKPDPEGINRALDFLKITKDETIYVGDAITDLTTAKNAGIKCCLVSWNLRGRHKDVNPDYYVDDCLELMEVIMHEK